MTRGGGVSRSRAANEGESQAKRARIGGAPQNIETEVRGARVLNVRDPNPLSTHPDLTAPAPT